jgi:hypothetical protein
MSPRQVFADDYIYTEYRVCGKAGNMAYDSVSLFHHIAFVAQI